MSDVIEFAKILRRIAKGSVWQEAFGSRSVEGWMLDAAIEEFGKRPAVRSYLVLCPRGHAVKYRRDDEEGVIYPVEYCERCKESRGRETSGLSKTAEQAGSHPVPSKLSERFWSKVDRKGPDECWLWTAGATSKGYGTFDIEDRTWRAHRVAWMLDHAMQDPGDLCVLHSCDTRLCVNPSHLFLGTNDENVADRDAKGRQARGSDNGGTKLTEDQVRDIRRRLSEGQVMAEIARVYGVQDSTIRDIREGVTWAHLDAEPSNLDALRANPRPHGLGLYIWMSKWGKKKDRAKRSNSA